MSKKDADANEKEGEGAPPPPQRAESRRGLALFAGFYAAGAAACLLLLAFGRNVPFALRYPALLEAMAAILLLLAVRCAAGLRRAGR